MLLYKIVISLAILIQLVATTFVDTDESHHSPLSVSTQASSNSSPQLGTLLKGTTTSKKSKKRLISEIINRDEENENEKKPKKKRITYNKPVGTQTNQAKIDSKINQLLNIKDNGIDDYDTAKKEAEDFLAKQKLKRNEKDRARHAIKKPNKLYSKKPGYQGKTQTIDRYTGFLMKKDKTLSR